MFDQFITLLKLAIFDVRKNIATSIIFISSIGFSISAIFIVGFIYIQLISGVDRGQDVTPGTLTLSTWGTQSYFDKNQPTKLPDLLTYRDAINIRDLDLVRLASPTYATGGIVETQDRAKSKLSRGRVVNDNFFELFNVPFQYGESWNLDREEELLNSIVISSSLNKKIFDGVNSVGKRLVLDGNILIISGVLKEWNLYPLVYSAHNAPFRNTEDFFIPLELNEYLLLDNWGSTYCWENSSVDTFKQQLTSECAWVEFWFDYKKEERNKIASSLINYLKDEKKKGRIPQQDIKVDLYTANEWLKYQRVDGGYISFLLFLSICFLALCLINTMMYLELKKDADTIRNNTFFDIGIEKKQISYMEVIELMVIGLAAGIFAILLSYGSMGLLRESKVQQVQYMPIEGYDFYFYQILASIILIFVAVIIHNLTHFVAKKI